MKYLVVSDIHGSLYYAKKLEEICIKENPDKIILLGDLYYNSKRNIFLDDDDIIEVAKILNKYKDKIICTKGNCDSTTDENISEFKFEEYVTLTINGVKFFFSHGNKYNMDNVPPEGDVVVYGHLHIGFIEKQYGVIFVNTGSISLPRGNSKNSYVIIDEKEIYLKDIDGNIIQKTGY